MSTAEAQVNLGQVDNDPTQNEPTKPSASAPTRFIFMNWPSTPPASNPMMAQATISSRCGS